jgi:hypothetical protein
VHPLGLNPPPPAQPPSGRGAPWTIAYARSAVWPPRPPRQISAWRNSVHIRRWGKGYLPVRSSLGLGPNFPFEPVSQHVRVPEAPAARAVIDKTTDLPVALTWRRIRSSGTTSSPSPGPPPGSIQLATGTGRGIIGGQGAPPFHSTGSEGRWMRAFSVRCRRSPGAATTRGKDRLAAGVSSAAGDRPPRQSERNQHIVHTRNPLAPLRRRLQTDLDRRDQAVHDEHLRRAFPQASAHSLHLLSSSVGGPRSSWVSLHTSQQPVAARNVATAESYSPWSAGPVSPQRGTGPDEHALPSVTPPTNLPGLDARSDAST